MLTHSQQQDEAAARMTNHMMAPANQNPIPNPLMNDLNFKMQHVQNQQQAQLEMMLSKLAISNVRQQPRTPPIPEMSLAQSRELLNRPEAQAILQGKLKIYIFLINQNHLIIFY